MVFSKKFVSECREHSTYLEHVAAPLFRRSFTISPGAEGEGVFLVVALRLPEAEADNSVKNSLFSGEVVVEGALPDAHRPGDVPNGDAVVSPPGEELQGGFDDFFLGGHGFLRRTIVSLAPSILTTVRFVKVFFHRRKNGEK